MEIELKALCAPSPFGSVRETGTALYTAPCPSCPAWIRLQTNCCLSFQLSFLPLLRSLCSGYCSAALSLLLVSCILMQLLESPVWLSLIE